jgi:hypothetical protein
MLWTPLSCATNVGKRYFCESAIGLDVLIYGSAACVPSNKQRPQAKLCADSRAI